MDAATQLNILTGIIHLIAITVSVSVLISLGIITVLLAGDRWTAKSPQPQRPAAGHGTVVQRPRLYLVKSSRAATVLVDR